MTRKGKKVSHARKESDKPESREGVTSSGRAGGEFEISAPPTTHVDAEASAIAVETSKSTHTDDLITPTALMHSKMPDCSMSDHNSLSSSSLISDQAIANDISTVDDPEGSNFGIVLSNEAHITEILIKHPDLSMNAKSSEEPLSAHGELSPPIGLSPSNAHAMMTDYSHEQYLPDLQSMGAIQPVDDDADIKSSSSADDEEENGTWKSVIGDESLSPDKKSAETKNDLSYMTSERQAATLLEQDSPSNSQSISPSYPFTIITPSKAQLSKVLNNSKTEETAAIFTGNEDQVDSNIFENPEKAPPCENFLESICVNVASGKLPKFRSFIQKFPILSKIFEMFYPLFIPLLFASRIMFDLWLSLTLHFLDMIIHRVFPVAERLFNFWLWIVLLPYNIVSWTVQRFWRIFLLFSVFVLNRTPGGHKVLKALNGHVMKH